MNARWKTLAVIGLGLPQMAAAAAVKPPGWNFPGAELVIGAGAAVALVLLGRALAAPSRRSETTNGQRRDA